MRHIKKYSQIFERFTGNLTKKQIDFLDSGLEKLTDSWSINMETGEIDVDGNFKNVSEVITDLEGLNFGIVTGNFDLFSSLISSLEGCPTRVGGEFDVGSARIKSLKGSPRFIGGDAIFHGNLISSLDGSPEEVGGSLWLSDNKLETLKGVTQNIGYSLIVSNNILTTLEGAPKRVIGDFSCSYNRLKNLIGGPEIVEGSYSCAGMKLDSLEGAPREVGESFYLDKNKPFGWSPKGKLGYVRENPESAKLLIPTMKFEEILDEVKENPSLMAALEYDENLSDGVIKELGLDKMGPDLLRMIKKGLF